VFVKASGLVTEAAWTSWTADQLRRYADPAVTPGDLDRARRSRPARPDQCPQI
jgi:hypothetical protein